MALALVTSVTSYIQWAVQALQRLRSSTRDDLVVTAANSVKNRSSSLRRGSGTVSRLLSAERSS